MAEQLDDRMKNWIAGVVDGVAISLDPPRAQATGQGVGLYLLELLRSSAMSPSKPAPLQIAFRYLVTAWAEQPEAAHDMLARLYFSAMEKTEFEVEREPPSTELWRAFGVSPQPAFLLRAPLLQERPRVPVKLVRQPLRVEMVSRVAFYGKVLGPEDIPLPNCTIAVPALGLSTSSDREGRFQFPGLPSSGNIEFVLKARSRMLAVNSNEGFPDSRSPMVIRFSSLED